MSTEPYIASPLASQLFADPAYQRDVDPKRVKAMAAAFDERLLGVIDVSKRDGTGRFAILDGQHRHALIVAVRGEDAPLVCNVYEALSIEEEAALFHQINVKRKPLNYWDQWKARRASGDERVALIEQVLTRYGLKVDPLAANGNVNATAALEVITEQFGDRELLDQVLDVLTCAFGRNRDAFHGRLMKALAMVLAVYPPDELNISRLVRQLADVAPRQLLARGAAMRELHSGTIDRLIAAVIVEQYNRAPGRRVEAFLDRVPAAQAKVRVQAHWRARKNSSAGDGPPRAVPAGADRPAGASGQPGENETDDGGLAGRDLSESLSSPPAASVVEDDDGPICGNCAHGRADHMELIPQCSAGGCTCLRFARDKALLR